MTKLDAEGAVGATTSAGVMGVSACSPPELPPNIVRTDKKPKTRAKVRLVDLVRRGMVQLPECLSSDTATTRSVSGFR